MNIEFGYDKDFDKLIDECKLEFPPKIFDIDGIGKQLDICNFSRDFFGSATTADASVDANANVSSNSVIAYDVEAPKPIMRLNSYYSAWKELKKLYGVEVANKIIKSCISGSLYIHDLHGIAAGKPYSYYKDSVIVLNIKNNIIYTSLENIYNILKEKYPETILCEDSYEIKLNEIQVLDDNQTWVDVSRIVKHRSNKNLVIFSTENKHTTIVTEDHPVILDNAEKMALDVHIGEHIKISSSYLPINQTLDINIDQAYLIGYLIAAGKVNIDTKTNVCFTINCKYKDTYKIFSIIKSIFKNCHIYDSIDNSTAIDFGSKASVNKILQLDVTNLNNELPLEIINWGIQPIRSLICGIIDSIGYIGANGIYSAEIKSFKLVQQLSELFEATDCGISRVCIKKDIDNIQDVSYLLTLQITNKALIKYSKKINANIDKIDFQEKIISSCNRIDSISFVRNDDYVYDITTTSGHFHCGGFIQHNCFNYSTYDIMEKGLCMSSKVKSLPPKYLHSFKSQLEQFVIIASNSTLGATGLADLLIIMSYYVKNLMITHKDEHFTLNSEEDCWNYVKGMLVSLIYSLNFDLRANQSPFTNVSVYDKKFMETVCENYLFPDGSTPDIDIVCKLQKLYLDTMNEEMERVALTFPVTTACFSVDEEGNILDKDFLEFISKENLKYGFINMYQGKSSTLSSCCFDGNQYCVVKQYGKVILSRFSDLYSRSINNDNKEYEVFYNGEWRASNIISAIAEKTYNITTENNKTLKATHDHIFPTIEGDKPVAQLSSNDYLEINNIPVSSSCSFDKKLTREQGIIIGMFIGSGKFSVDFKDTIFLRLPVDLMSYYRFCEILEKSILKIGEEATTFTYDKKNEYASIYDKNIVNLIYKYVQGNYNSYKILSPDCLNNTIAFREGIVEGYNATQPEMNTLVSSKGDVLRAFECLLSSLGIYSRIDKIQKNGQIELQDDQIELPEYNINPSNYLKLTWGDSFEKEEISSQNLKIVGNRIFVKIKEIKEYSSCDDIVYCFKMKEEVPYFVLPNGIVSHNCRLRSDNKSEYFNSFGAGSTKIGSLGVCSINFPRLAYKNKGNKEGYFKELATLIEYCSKINNAKRSIIKTRIKNGNEPLYTYGFMDINKQYSTVGVQGFNESIENMGYNILDDEGIAFAIEVINFINKENEKYEKQYLAPHNCEAVPAETLAVRFAEKDKLLGYQNKYDLYSNQFIPLTTSVNMLERIRIQGVLDKYFSGGSILHLNCDTKIEDWHDMADLIEMCAKSGVIYEAVNYVLNGCENGHITVGDKDVCSVCGGKITDHYMRVVGFITNVKNWNKVRRTKDFPNRQLYGKDDFKV